MGRQRLPYQRVIESLDLLSILAPFDPVVIGTPPLGIDVPGSDIDVACSAPDLAKFLSFVRDRFGTLPGFVAESVDGLDEPAVRAVFRHSGWEVELFCQTLPTPEQAGVRHFEVERRLLASLPALGALVRDRKAAGLKTEPAFAAVLGLTGEPYGAMLELASRSQAELAALARSALACRSDSAQNSGPES